MRRGRVSRLRVTLMGEANVRHHKKVHELVAMAFLGARPADAVVRHLDGDAKNNAVWNLAYGSHKDNMKDAVRHGTTTRGEANHKAIVTAEVVKSLRQMEWRRGEQVAAAKTIGISAATLNCILKRRTWAWL
jgi:hypothetical protein